MTAIAPHLVRADDAEILGFGPNTLRLLADGSDTGGALSVIRSTLGKDTDGAAPHRHTANGEMFYLLEGGLHVLVGDTIVTARAGDFLFVPPGAAHAFRTPADTGVDMLFLMPSTDRFDYFRLAARLQRGEIGLPEFQAAQAGFDNHFAASPAWEAFKAAPPR
jgi:mannose-6-phosphate isomerase-like protein (cupin superfamily)